MSVQAAVRDIFQNAADQLIPQAYQFFRCFFHFCHSKLSRPAKANDARNIFRTGAFSLFLRPAENKRFDVHTFADIDCPNAFRRAQLMPTHGKQINVHFLHIDWHMPHSLHCVRMEQYAMLSGNSADFRNRFYRTDFIICEHYRNQDCFRTDGVFQFLQRNFPKLIYRQICYLCSVLLQIFRRMQYGMVFNFCRDDVAAFFRISLRDSPQSHVVAFRAACRKINFLRLCTNSTGDLPARVFQRAFALFRNPVNAGRISIIFPEIRQYGI